MSTSRSWHESLNPKLPCLASPSPNSDPTKPFKYTFSDENPFLEHIDIAKAAKAARLLLGRQNKASQEGCIDSTDTSTPAWWQAERPPDGAQPQAHQAAHRPQGGGGFANLVQHLVERAREEKARAMGETYHPPPSVVLANAAAAEAGREEHELTAPPSEASGPSTLVEPASPTAAASPTLRPSLSAFIEAAFADLFPSAVAPSSPGSLSMTPEELAHRVQSKGSVRLQALSKSLNAGALAKIEAAIHDESLIDDFKPHMLHKAHEPFREHFSCPRRYRGRRLTFVSYSYRPCQPTTSRCAWSQRLPRPSSCCLACRPSPRREGRLHVSRAVSTCYAERRS